MSAIDGMYVGAILIVIARMLNAPPPPNEGSRIFAIGYTFVLLVSHFLAFGMKQRDYKIDEEFSTPPTFGRWGTLIVLIWFIGGPTCMSLANAVR